jgi:hypothetical protein
MPEELEKRDKQSTILNIICLCYASVILLALKFTPEHLNGSTFRFVLFWGYFLSAPIALAVLLCARSTKVKAGAKRVIIGFILTLAVFPLAFPARELPAGRSFRGHP